ncbi:MAG: hypothetical protein AB7O68_16890 [Pirellulales bacterium]
MPVIAVVGMAGSGKSGMIKEYVAQGWKKYDDIFVDNYRQVRDARAMSEAGEKVIISDVEFCDPVRRFEIEQLGIKVDEWIFFENNPWQCAKNCLYRYLYEKDRRIEEELRAIRRLTRIYGSPDNPRPVVCCPDPPNGQLR